MLRLDFFSNLAQFSGKTVRCPKSFLLLYLVFQQYFRTILAISAKHSQLIGRSSYYHGRSFNHFPQEGLFRSSAHLILCYHKSVFKLNSNKTYEFTLFFPHWDSARFRLSDLHARVFRAAQQHYCVMFTLASTLTRVCDAHTHFFL